MASTIILFIFIICGCFFVYDKFNLTNQQTVQNALSVATATNIIDDFELSVKSISWDSAGISCVASNVQLFIENGDVLRDGTRIARFSMLLPANIAVSNFSSENLEKVKKLVNLNLFNAYQHIRYCNDIDVLNERICRHPAFANGILVDNVFITEQSLVFEVFEVANPVEQERAQQILRRLHLLPNSRTRVRNTR